MIRFKEAHLRFDTGISLRDLNFQVKKNEFVYLHGSSGCGKSSILKMIYMDLFPNEGEVTVFDYNSNHVKRRDIASVRQRIGMVFQDFKLLMDRDVYSNIALPLELLGLKSGEVRRKVAMTADELGLRSRLNHFPYELSGGEQQRVALARAMVNSPDLILADEPTANLDAKAATEALEWIWKVHNDGTCVIFATHKDQLLKQEPSRTLSLVSGEIIEDR